MLHEQTWPIYDENKIQEELIELPVQVNGKVRGKIMVNIEDPQEAVREKAMKNESIMRHIEGKKYNKGNICSWKNI